MYKLHLRVMDTYGQTKCILFDSNTLAVVNESELLQGSYDDVSSPTMILNALF